MDKKITERCQRWQAFYDRQQAASHRLIIRFKEDRPARPAPNPDKKADRIAWAWRQYQEQLENLQWLDDDAIPHLDAYTGTEIFAEAFGCQVQRAPDAMPFALPLIRRATEVTKLKVPDLSAPCLSLLFEIAHKLRERAGTSAVMRCVKLIPGLALLNLVQPPEVLRLAYQQFAASTAQMHSWIPEGDLANQVQALPAGSRVVLQVAADSKDQARNLVAAFRAIHHCA